MNGRTSDWKKELGRFLEPFLARLGHKARRRMCPLYVSGLIGPGDRKSIQPMAERLAMTGYGTRADMNSCHARSDLRSSSTAMLDQGRAGRTSRSSCSSNLRSAPIVSRASSLVRTVASR
jgi:SRSO17 transposase